MARIQHQSLYSEVFAASTTHDFSSIASGAEEAVDITVPGAALGDVCEVSLSIDCADLVLDAQVTAADTVTVVAANNTGGAVDLASCTIRVLAKRVDWTPIIALT